MQRIQVKYIYWKITTTVVRSCDSGATVTKKVRWEWVPEGLNGGSGTSFRIKRNPPPPPDKDNCAGLAKGKWQNVTRGRATRLDGSVSVGGFSLSAQPGYNDSMSVKTTAEDRRVQTCGYHGPAATDPGQLVAIKG